MTVEHLLEEVKRTTVVIVIAIPVSNWHKLVRQLDSLNDLQRSAADCCLARPRAAATDLIAGESSS